MWRVGDDPRALWKPILADLFGLLPWDVGRLTAGEYEQVADYIKRMNEANAK